MCSTNEKYGWLLYAYTERNTSRSEPCFTKSPVVMLPS